MAELHQQDIDQLELAPHLVGVVAGHIVQDRDQLPRDGVGQQLGCSVFQGVDVSAARIQPRCETLGEQQVVEAVG